MPDLWLDFTPDEQHHVAAVWNAGECVWFVDGKAVD